MSPLDSPEAEFGRALRRARETAGLSLRELARRLTRSHSNLWDYERGHRLATAEVVADYERALDLPAGSLTAAWERARVEIYGPDRTRRRPFREPLGQGASPPVATPSAAASRPGRPPLRRQPRPELVGRNDALGTVREALGEAVAGDVRILVLRGDAGIGKSTLLANVMGLAAELGFEVRAGSCPEGTGVPYLALTAALRALLEENPSAARARPGSALEVFLGAAPAAPAGDWESNLDRSRLQLFAAAAECLLAATDRAPQALVVDDLHWADAATVELLEYLVSTAAQRAVLSPTPLLVAVATRAPVSGSPAEKALQRFAREEGYRALDLDGLTDHALTQLVAQFAGGRPSPPLVRSIAAATAGNPLLVRTVLRRLGSDPLKGADEALIGRTLDLDSELRAQVDSLEEGCQRLLEVAAALGDGSLAELHAGFDGPPEHFDARLDQALASGLLVEEPDGRYRFEHPQIPHAILGRLAPRHARRLHAALAERLERHHGALADGCAPSIARHLRLAGGEAPPPMIRHHGALAGDMAFAVGAWGDAGQLYDMALGVADEGDPALPELRMHAAVSHFRDHDHAATVERLVAVIDRARTNDDHLLWGRAALLLAKSQTTAGSPAQAAEVLEEYLQKVSDIPPELEARAWAELSNARFALWDFAGGMEVAARALALAEACHDDEVGAEVETSAGIQELAMLRLGEAGASFCRSIDHALRLDDPWALAWGKARLPLVQWAKGELLAADRLAAEASELAASHFDWAEGAMALAARTGIATAQGRFDAAERFGLLGYQQYLRSDYLFAQLLIAPSLAAGRLLRGDGPGAEKALQMVEALGIDAHRFRQIGAALAGNVEVAREALAATPVTPRDPAALTLFDVPFLALEAELGDFLDDAELLGTVAPALRAVAARGLICTIGWPASISRLLGVCALAAGDVAEAEDHLRHAAEFAVTEEADLEAARARLDLARALHRGATSRRREAEALAAEAGATLALLGTTPLVERARRAR